MKITVVYDGILPVVKYGGTQRIVYWLIKELVLMGHQVSVISNPNSNLSSIGATLIPNTEGELRALIPKNSDIVLFNNTPTFEIDLPFVVRIDGNGKPGEQFLKNTCFLSQNHANNHNADFFIYNGLDMSEYPNFELSSSADKWNSFAFLAKASWKVKNLKQCIQACRTHKKNLHVAGGSSIIPSRYIKYYGMVDLEGKHEVLSKSDAFLWPVKWHEPFGIAVLEAFAKGLPVIASSYGSSPELVKEHVGYVCANYQEFEEKVGMDRNIFDRREIRNYVETNFSTALMAKRYVESFERVISGESLNRKKPSVDTDFNPGALLPF